MFIHVVFFKNKLIFRGRLILNMLVVTKGSKIKIIKQQECIPVGCVPSTAVATWRGGHVSQHALGRGCIPACTGWGVCIPACTGQGVGVCPGVCVSAQGVSARGCLPGGVCLGGVCHTHTPSLTRHPHEQNHRCL